MNDELNKHSLNRVKKNINDYIMKNYLSLFATAAKPDGARMVVTKTEILSNQKLL